MANEVRTFTLNDDPGQVIEDLNAAFDGTTQTALKAGDVKDSINGIPLNEIFESDGRTVKNATSSTPLGVIEEYYGIELPPHYLWADGRTIGDELSNATARANADVFGLYSVLWGAVNNMSSQINIFDSNGILATKGLSAAADFAAHKAISLPDKRGRVGIGLDNMGGTSANVVRDGNADVVGGFGGEEKHTQTVDELVPHNHKIGSPIWAAGSPNQQNRIVYEYPDPYSITTTSTGGGQPFNIMQPWIACNYIIRY